MSIESEEDYDAFLLSQEEERSRAVRRCMQMLLECYSADICQERFGIGVLSKALDKLGRSKDGLAARSRSPELKAHFAQCYGGSAYGCVDFLQGETRRGATVGSKT